MRGTPRLGRGGEGREPRDRPRRRWLSARGRRDRPRVPWGAGPDGLVAALRALRAMRAPGRAPGPPALRATTGA